MRDLNQQNFKFKQEKNFKNEDFYISKSNENIFNFLLKWPKWEKNFLNISGERFSGKTHLINIFLNKSKGIKLNNKVVADDKQIVDTTFFTNGISKLSFGKKKHIKLKIN